jgi:hypothetical protein
MTPVRCVPLLLVLALAGCASGSRHPTSGSKHPTVPSQVRNTIAKDYPGMAFVPARLPSGYRYANWMNCRNHACYALIFENGPVDLDLRVISESCPAPPKYPAKNTHTLHVNGQALKWMNTNNGPYVWRCMTNRGRPFVIFGGPDLLQRATELVGYALPAH